MKFAIILIVLSLSFINCETKGDRKEKKNSSKFNELYSLYTWYMHYDLYDACPAPLPTIFNAGISEISLKKGETLYFDMAPRINTERAYTDYYYYVGVSKDISSSNIAVNMLFLRCMTSRSKQTPIVFQTAKDISYPIDYSDSEYNYYKYFMRKVDDRILTLKSLNEEIKFKLKIPDKGVDL